MDTQYVKEHPIAHLQNSSYDEEYTLDIWPSDLKAVPVGYVFTPEKLFCGRDVREESMEIVYKNDDGVAAVKTVRRTSDDPTPQEWYDPAAIIWFALH